MRAPRKPIDVHVKHDPIVQTLLDAASAHAKDYPINLAAGLTINYLSQIRHGRIRDPGLGSLRKLAAVLGFEVVLQPLSVPSTDNGQCAGNRPE